MTPISERSYIFSLLCSTSFTETLNFYQALMNKTDINFAVTDDLLFSCLGM